MTLQCKVHRDDCCELALYRYIWIKFKFIIVIGGFCNNYYNIFSTSSSTISALKRFYPDPRRNWIFLFKDLTEFLSFLKMGLSDPFNKEKLIK